MRHAVPVAHRCHAALNARLYNGVLAADASSGDASSDVRQGAVSFTAQTAWLPVECVGCGTGRTLESRVCVEC